MLGPCVRPVLARGFVFYNHKALAFGDQRDDKPFALSYFDLPHQSLDSR